MGSSVQLSLLVFVLLHSILLLPYPVTCDVEEDNLLQGLNSYRQSLNLSALTRNDKAGCLADEIANQLDHNQPCISNTAAGSQPKITDYDNLLNKCNIKMNSTNDGVILPVCVPKRVPTLVLTNFTRTQYSKYLNSSKYTGAGVGSEDDWVVVIMTTNSPTGSFVNGVDLVSKVGLSRCLLFLFLEVFLALLN